MDSKQSQPIRLYIDIFLRKKVLITTCLLLGVAVGLALNVVLPKQYRSTALLSYQQQKINPNRMSPEVEEKIHEMVATLTQIVTSRTDLEKIITDIGLYKEARKRLPMEDVVDMMRENIDISSSGKGGDTFTVSFTGGRPDQVVRVVNSLAGKFIEENLKLREDRATETSSYTSNELQMAKAVLDKKDDIMRDYKLKHYYEMPDQQEANLTRLNSLQQQYQGKQDSIQDLERTRVMLQDQITTRKNTLTAETATSAATKEKEILSGNAAEGESDAQQLERLKKLYGFLLIKYTDKHPEVIRVRHLIKKLEHEMGGQTGGGNKGGSAVRSRSVFDTDPLIAQLTLQMKKLEIDINNLTKEKQQLGTLIKQYEKWVADAPVREAEWASLTREYGQLKKHYDYLVAQNLQAQSNLRIEQKQKGSQFKIEDPGGLPQKPYSPNFYKIMGIAVMVGLGLGCGIAFAEVVLDSSFKDVTEIETYLDLPVVCSIPYIYTEKEKRRDRIRSVGWAVAFFTGLLLLGGVFFYFLHQGRIVL